MARGRIDRDGDGAKALLDGAMGNLEEAIRELRELARGIHPAVLSARGLGSAVEALAQRMPLPIEITCVPDERLPEPVEAAAYFVVAEAITNVARYAGASHAQVDVRCADGELVVSVVDDGIGGADPRSGSGLRGLSDRIAALDGRLEVLSPAGVGTTVRAVIPR
jgi:signal transduction histidine kinase